jgi:hypothetical protein
VVNEYIYEVDPLASYPGAPTYIMLGKRIPLAAGATKSQARCESCGMNWLRVNRLAKKWERAGGQSR